MSPTPSAIDPLTGLTISVTDSHFSVVELYYQLLPIYTAEKNNAAAAYQRAWHDYAVLLLNTAEFMNIKVRPPGFKTAPVPPNFEMITLNKDYTLTTTLVPVAVIPPDPDPAKQTLQPVPGNPSEYNIVDITPAGQGSGGLIAAPTTQNVTQDQVVAYLKLHVSDLSAILNLVLAK